LEERYESIENEFIMYEPLFLKIFKNEEGIMLLTQSLEAADCAFLVI